MSNSIKVKLTHLHKCRQLSFLCQEMWHHLAWHQQKSTWSSPEGSARANNEVLIIAVIGCAPPVTEWRFIIILCTSSSALFNTRRDRTTARLSTCCSEGAASICSRANWLQQDIPLQCQLIHLELQQASHVHPLLLHKEPKHLLDSQPGA